VVPDLATREHLRNLGPLLERAKDQVGFGQASLVAVTNGPGLAACLAIGVAAAKSLALALNVPVVAVNHLRGHVWSPFIALQAESPARFHERLQTLLPHLGLIVSGGTRCFSSSMIPGASPCLRRRGMTRLARPWTRGPSCWGSAIRAGP
jgi:N6-L-threonylcarbamoyladenine synthase